MVVRYLPPRFPHGLRHSMKSIETPSGRAITATANLSDTPAGWSLYAALSAIPHGWRESTREHRRRIVRQGYAEIPIERGFR